MTDLVFGFDYPHPTGAICAEGCPYCACSDMFTVAANGGTVPNVPLKILGPATEDDWRRSARQHGADLSEHATSDARCFYWVQTD